MSSIYLRQPYPNELYHHGINGQKWGVRRYQNPDGTLTTAGKERYRVSKFNFRTRSLAKKDAKEYARAKMSYGEGAGNRRKLIKSTVDTRSKDDTYKKYFDEYYAKQDLAKHAAAAKRERTVKDTTKTASKTARGMYHLYVRDAAKVTAGAAILYGILHKTGYDVKIKDAMIDKYSNLSSSAREAAFRRQFINKWKDVKIA